MIQLRCTYNNRISTFCIQHRMINKPTISCFDNSNALFFAGWFDNFHSIKIALFPITPLIIRTVCEAPICRGIFISSITSREQSTCHRIISIETHSKMIQTCIQLSFRFFGQRIVNTLKHCWQYPTVSMTYMPYIRYHPCREIGKPQLSEFSFLIKIVANF